MNLSLYSINAFLILDSEGGRVLAKYYRPKSNPNEDSKWLHTIKDQRAFEKGLWSKTKKAGGEIILFDGRLAVYKHSLDIIIYLVSGPAENELMLVSALHAFTDAVGMLLKNQVEKRAVLENLDLVLLCLDETIDDGIIVETDSVAIASRVSRPRADASDMVINEQTLLNAYSNIKDRVQKQISQMQ